MRITFLKNDDHNCYFAYNSTPGNGYYFHFHDSILDILEKHLYEHFSRELITINRCPHVAYKVGMTFDLSFKREEDEAFFLIWSADGIEV